MHKIAITEDYTYDVCATPGCDKTFLIPVEQFGARNYCDQCAGRDSDMVALVENKVAKE